MTGFVFDLPSEVEFQEELRFMSILQGRSEISFRPPRDLAAGESLRLTVKLGTGALRQEATFFLVSHPGQATHQVEVYHDTRPRESLLQEATEERARNQRLQEENRRLIAGTEQLRSTLHRLNGLTGAYLINVLTHKGIPAMKISLNPPPTELFVSDAYSYRSDITLALEVGVRNSSTEQWTAIGVSLVDDKGHPIDGVILSQEEPIAPQSYGKVFLEAVIPPNEAETYTLNLMENGPRTVTLPRVIFPH